MTESEQAIVDAVREYVCTELKVTEDELDGNRKDKRISHARRLAMSVIYQMTDLGTTRVGRIFGGKHHSTVVLAYKRTNPQAVLQVANKIKPRPRPPKAGVYGTKMDDPELSDGRSSCTCLDSCKPCCRGECGCKRCREDYQDFLSYRD